MSLLGRMLEAKNPTFNLAISQLEDLTGKDGVDTALVGEILAKAYEHAAQLGLDADMKGKELYYALNNRIKQDDERLAHQLGGQQADDVAQMVPLAVKKVKSLKLTKTGWFLKPKVARRLLRAQPPTNLTKQLGYKNGRDLVQHEDIYELFVALRFSEDANWMNKKFLPQYKDLTFGDFEKRPIKIITLDPTKWGYELTTPFVKKKLHNITHSKEMGVVVVLPMHIKTMPGITLKVLSLLLHYLYEVQLYSSFFKLISFNKKFGKVLLDTLIADTAHVPIIDGAHHVHWRVIQRYFGKLKHEDHPEDFQPHVHPEDLHWRKAEEVLYEVDPALRFWKDMDYVALELDGEVVTFNLMDVVFSYSNGCSYEERNLYHFRESLWNEVFMRYMGKDALRSQILEKLNNQLIRPEKLKA